MARCAAAGVGLALGVAGNLSAADGGALYKARACQACHGDDAKTTVLPIYPKLAGQNAPYLLEQMKAIRDGTRTNGLSAAMRPLMASVPDEEFQSIAEWLATLK
ncbi:cytochrome C (plasmid) [Candidatus Thiodictyon syntrophicum]|uniref:Cytochrome C n=1 Tax=Candidatus Thiodictyon syntrophicum TaxID=1166950 RepID=A0A2K8UJI8_9GAMM|nr:c-type cytochrome [Candidatus Thiodictyon syntrophicum]AUB85734.1 cytochrome C [Candidatus Thiodictyon syntrophicum]